MARRERSLEQWQGAIDQQIREAMVRGEFDDLPGTGQPLPGLDGRRDDDWWIKGKLKREQISYLPPGLALRKEVEDARAQIAAAATEDAVRDIVTAINVRIGHVNSRHVSGPPSDLMPLDIERVLERWRPRPPPC
jgi:hypothetical protein